jgi:hypothetical protein
MLSRGIQLRPLCSESERVKRIHLVTSNSKFKIGKRSSPHAVKRYEGEKEQLGESEPIQESPVLFKIVK